MGHQSCGERQATKDCDEDLEDLKGAKDMIDCEEDLDGLESADDYLNDLESAEAANNCSKDPEDLMASFSFVLTERTTYEIAMTI